MASCKLTPAEGKLVTKRSSVRGDLRGPRDGKISAVGAMEIHFVRIGLRPGIEGQRAARWAFAPDYSCSSKMATSGPTTFAIAARQK